MKKIIFLLTITILSVYGNNFDTKANESNGKKYTCDGRQYCSQMSSCEEAKFFINNCPNTKMDGDHDGKPCEKRCGH